MGNIGAPKRIIEVEPEKAPVPSKVPKPERTPVPKEPVKQS